MEETHFSVTSWLVEYLTTFVIIAVKHVLQSKNKKQPYYCRSDLPGSFFTPKSQNFIMQIPPAPPRRRVDLPAARICRDERGADRSSTPWKTATFGKAKIFTGEVQRPRAPLCLLFQQVN